MKKLYVRDNYKRQVVAKKELDRLLFKFFLKSNLDVEIKSLVFVMNSRKFCFKNFVRIKNRCYFTNRSRSVFRFFKISRISLKELGNFGFISGLRKSSW